MTITARRARTREKLLTAAVPVFAKRGVAGASIEELCEAAGLTRGAFYSNFEGKEELVLALIEQQMDQAIGHITDRAEAAGGMSADGTPNSCSIMAEATPAERAKRAEQLAAEAIDALSEEAVSFVPDSRDWVIAQREIELYALRTPGLQTRFRELVDTQLARIAEIVTTILAQHGAKSTIPMDELVGILAAVGKDQQFTALVANPDSDTAAFNPEQTIRVLLAFIEFV